jgi:HEPN domain-containing protein
MENFEFLKERAKEFWERGFEDFEKKRLNLSAFDFEQAIQMWVKYLGDAYFTSRYFPKNFSENHIKEIVENCKKFLKFLEEKVGEKFI